MTLRSSLLGAVTFGALAALPAAPALAQSDLPARGAPLARRVADVRDGTARMTFAVRPDVCGSGRSIRTGRNGRTTWGNDDRRSRDVEWDDECDMGPGRLALDVRGGEVQAVRFYVGGRWRSAGSEVTDLGQVPAAQAAGLLLGIAERGQNRASRDAILPSTLVDSVAVWPVLLKIARDDRADRETRSQSVFWLGNAAGDAATKGLADLADDAESEIRDQAVFALSRRPDGDGVPSLIRIARSHRDPKTRRSAMFWLGNSKDPRAIALFEEILTGK